MKKLLAAILILCFAACCAAESGLPSLSGFVSESLPSLRHSAQKNPDSEETLSDGSKRLVFSGITADIYDSFGKYLSSCGYSYGNVTYSGSTLSVNISKGSLWFNFSYNYETLKATLIYPYGMREETVDLSASAGTLYCKPGSYITFGSYPQSSAAYTEPIEWLVLEVRGDSALIISRYGLDAKRYNDDFVSVTWSECSLRKWLNNSFLNTAFTKDEQKKILVTTVDNGSSQGYGSWSTKGGYTTQDKIFLLSYAEANDYFGVAYWRTSGLDAGVLSRAEPTVYAVNHGASTLNSTGDEWWWLRSPGYNQVDAACVSAYNGLPYHTATNTAGIVRPALWITL